MSKDNEIQERGRKCVSMEVEKEAYQRIKTKISQLKDTEEDKNKIKKALNIYYDNAEPTITWNNIKKHFDSMSFPVLIDNFMKISGEAINRDMIAYVLTGNRGKLASKMYNEIKK